MILVTGATGNTGSEVVRALVERGAPVRAFVRDAEKALRLFCETVELALGDFADAASVRSALEGVDALFLSCADDPRRVDWETSAVDAAAQAGVGRVVKLSTIGAEPGAPVAFWDWHGRVEQHLRSSAIPAVVLHSSFSMTNLYFVGEQVATLGRFFAPAGEARISMIDPRDVGAAAAAVLTDAFAAGRTYVLTGPTAITYADVADDLAAVTGRDVEFVDVPDDAARQGMVDSGVPDFVADQIVAIFQQLRAGVAAEVTDGVERLTGGPPRSFADFARDHAAVFTTAAPSPLS